MHRIVDSLFRRHLKKRRQQTRQRWLGMESLEERCLLTAVTLTPVKDNSLIAYSASSNPPYSGGADPDLYLGLEHTTGAVMRGLMAFDVAGNVPAGATINSVTLTGWVSLTYPGTPGTLNVQLHKTLADWGVGTSNGTGRMPGIPWDRATTGDATWLQTFFNSNTALNKWATPGGDFSPTVSGVTGFGADGTSAKWSSTAQMVADVQGWLNDPTRNFGWVLKSDEIQDIGIYLDSSEATNLAHRPTLTIDYTVAAALPDIAISDATLAEGNAGTTTAIFDVTLSAASSQSVTVNYATANGTAVAGADYQTTSGTLTFSPGQTAKTISVPVIGESVVELNETFSVNLSGAQNANVADSQGVGTISNDDSASLAINDVTLAEGNAGTTNFSFTVTLSAAVGAPVSVDFSTANGTATLADNDYAAASGTLNFAGNAGETKTIVVPVNGDQKFEPDETFLVNLTNLSANGGNVTSADSQGSGTITNDDTSNLPALTIGDATLVEGHTGTSSVQFDVQLSAVSSDTVTVNFATADDAAVAGVDYQAASGPLTFLPGETVQSISVTITGDTVVELDESFLVKLSGPQNAILADPQGVGTITNDDSAALSIDDVTLTEGNAGTTNATFTVTLSAAVDASVSVDFSTANGTATAADSDYAASSGKLTFTGSAGETKTVTVLVNGDQKVELDETFLVNLANIVASGRNVTMLDGQGQGSITNDDSAGLSINDITLAEGNAGTTNFTFTVTLDAAVDAPVNVDFSTADGTATAADKDYTAATGTVTFAPNETSQTISITVNGDTQVEPDEDFFVNLSNPTNATIADSQGIGTITNDDSTDLPTLSISDVTRAEGNDGTTSFTFTVTLNGPAGGPVSVDFTTADGTATAGDATTDGGTSGTDDDDGDGSQADDDGDDETDDHETEDPGDGDRADENGEQDGQGGTEHDAEDHNGAEHRGEDSEHEHGEESDGEGEDREHSGGAGGDYTPTSGTLHFTGAAGETQTITVDVQVDTQVEPDETFFVQLSNAVGAVIANGQGTGTITNDDTTTVRQRRWQNPRDQHDVNDADGVSALDVLMLINYINDHPGRASMPASDGTSPPYYDVSGDDACTAMDVLQVINRINQSAGRAGEGEAVPLAVAPAEPTQSVTPDSMPWPDLTDSSPAADPANPSSLQQDSANPSRSASTWPVPKQTNQAWSRAVSSQGNRLGGGLQESPFDREVDFSELEAVLSVIGQDVERAWQQF